MDFIIKLPVSKEPEINQSYNSIFIATDRLTKYRYFISYRKDILVFYDFYIIIYIWYHNMGFPKKSYRIKINYSEDSEYR
jgi:hypothetical protein